MRHVSKRVPMLFVLVAAIGLVACGGSGEENGDEKAGGNSTAAAKPDKGPESASMGGKVPTVVIRDGEPVGGVAALEYSAGDEIRFEVVSDVADEVHVHGYDLMEDVAAGGTASFDFPAEIEGIFEVELEGRGVEIAELRVNP
jgi:hypothetical protein